MEYVATALTKSDAGPDWRSWSGRILSGLVILFFLMDGAMKLVPLQVVIDTTTQIGWPADTPILRSLGLILIASTLLYAWRPTSILGAVLLTAYLGGAVATHIRIGSPLFTHSLFGVYMGVMAWAGLWLRDPELRALLPLKN